MTPEQISVLREAGYIIAGVLRGEPPTNSGGTGRDEHSWFWFECNARGLTISRRGVKEFLRWAEIRAWLHTLPEPERTVFLGAAEAKHAHDRTFRPWHYLPECDTERDAWYARRDELDAAYHAALDALLAGGSEQLDLLGSA